MFDMPGAELRMVTLDAFSCGRERRIHHDRVKALLSRQQVIQALGVQRGRLESLQFQECPPPWVDLVDFDFCAQEACQDGEVARAGTRLQNRHTRTRNGSLDDDEGLRVRRAELLQFDLAMVSRRLWRETLAFTQQQLERGLGVPQWQAGALQVEVEPGFGGVVGIAGVSG